MIKLCWQCGKKLAVPKDINRPTYSTIWFGDSPINVHKTCRKDAENLLSKNKVTFQGEESVGPRSDDR